VIDKFWAYYRHAFDPRNFRVVMALLVKNEADIIETNIRVHAALGVDAFVVMDHLSSDGTREVLTALAGEYELHILDQRDPVYRQSQWMTRLACYARDRLAADWVVCNDADEFWLPQKGGSLKELLAFKKAYVTCRRFNMLLDRSALQPGYRFHDSRLRVDSPIFYGNDELYRDSVSIVLSKIGPKVIVNPHGLIKIKGGNHRARHAANWLDYHKPYDRLEKFEGIAVYHYSMRGWKHFERNVRQRMAMLEKEPGIRMGNHYRRWAELCRQGRLKEEYGRFVLAEEELRALKKFGVVTEDDFPGRMIKQALGWTGGLERKTA
jgi:hypothetical protein